MSVILLLTRTLNNCFLSPEPALMRSELCDEQRTTERPARAAEGRPGQSGERERERESGESLTTHVMLGTPGTMWACGVTKWVSSMSVKKNIIFKEVFQRISSFCQTFS